MKALQLWDHPANKDVCIKNFKTSVRTLLKQFGVADGMLLLGAKVIDEIFVG